MEGNSEVKVKWVVAGGVIGLDPVEDDCEVEVALVVPGAAVELSVILDSVEEDSKGEAMLVVPGAVSELSTVFDSV